MNTNLPDFNKLWDFNKPHVTEQKFRELIPAAQESGDQEYYLQLLTQVARTEGLQKKFEEAHVTLDEVQDAITPETPVAKIRYFLERGRVFNSSSQAELALPLFARAFELSVEGKNDDFAVDAAHMIAIAEPLASKKMEWNLKALEVAEKSSDEKAKGWVGSLYNNIGWTYHDAGDFEKGLELFKKAQAWREARGEPSSIIIAKWCVARALRSLKRSEEALEIQKALEVDCEKASQPDGYVFQELAAIYLELGQAELAHKYSELAKSLLV